MRFFVCYKSTDGFERYLQNPWMLLFAYHPDVAIWWNTEKDAIAQIDSFRGRYHAKDLATLYVKEMAS